MTFSFPELKRPQYPASTEVLLSALAWSVIPRKRVENVDGLIYRRVSDEEQASGKRRRTKVKVHQTAPRGEEKLEDFRKALEEGMNSGTPKTLASFAAQAVVNSSEGVQSPRAVSRSSSAIGLTGALLQDPVGALTTQSPPDFAGLFNSIYALGGGREHESAANLWFQAASYHANLPVLRPIEKAFYSTTLMPFVDVESWPPTGPVPLVKTVAAAVPDWWRRELLGANGIRIETPFSWFAHSWERLCSPVWYEQLPPRRWASWAICVMRTAMAFSFLWEANFYLSLARGIVDTSSDVGSVTRAALSPVLPLVPYQRGGIAESDVRPALRQRLAMGLGCRDALIQAAQSIPDRVNSLREFVEYLRASNDRGFRNALKSAIAGSGYSGGLPNLQESVIYSLLDRGTVQDPDDYSLLRTISGRYYHVSPGPEWIVVMSALAVPNPGPSPRLGDVRGALDALGLRPRIDFLLSELERAGLCASAPDGDDGIKINLGFSGN